MALRLRPVIEPPAFGLVRGTPQVAAFISAVEKLIATDRRRSSTR